MKNDASKKAWDDFFEMELLLVVISSGVVIGWQVVVYLLAHGAKRLGIPMSGLHSLIMFLIFGPVVLNLIVTPILAYRKAVKSNHMPVHVGVAAYCCAFAVATFVLPVISFVMLLVAFMG